MSKAATKKAKQEDLPGMENRQIPDLDEAAREYAEGRDERMEMTRKEVELKTNLIEMMHKHKKKTYIYDGIEIELVPEGEKVKVKVRKEKEEAEAE